MVLQTNAETGTRCTKYITIIWTNKTKYYNLQNIISHCQAAQLVQQLVQYRTNGSINIVLAYYHLKNIKTTWTLMSPIVIMIIPMMISLRGLRLY